MAKPIEIQFSSDTSEVIRGTNNIADGFEDVADSLRDLERNSDDATDKLEDGSKDAERAAEDLEKQLKDVLDSTDKLEKSGRDAFDKLADSARAAGKKTGDSMEGGLDRAADGMGEFKDEANSTAREAAASFDGSAESISDVFQELAANAFSGFGPAGAAAGLAAAVGIGIAISKMQELAETNTEAKEAMAELGREIYATGGRMDEADLAQKISDIAFSLGQEDVWWQWGDQAKTNVGLVKDALEGVSDEIAKDAFKGLAGDLEAASRAQAELEESIRRDTEALEQHVILVDEYGNKYLSEEGQAIEDSIKSRQDLSKKIEEETGVRQGANEEVDYYTDIMGESTEAIEAQNEALEANAEALDRAAGKAMDADKAEIDYAKSVADSSETIKENGRTLDINTEKGRENRQALIDQADSAHNLIDALIQQGGSTADVTAKTESARAAFIKSAEAAGYTRSEALKLADQYGLIPENVDTKVQAHGVQETKESLDGLEDPRTAVVNARIGDTSSITGYFASLQGRSVAVRFQARPGRDSVV